MCVGGGGVERGGNKIRTKGWEGKYRMKRGKTENRRKEGGGRWKYRRSKGKNPKQKNVITSC